MAKRNARPLPPTNRPASARPSSRRRAARSTSAKKRALPKPSSSSRPKRKPQTVILETRSADVGELFDTQRVTYQRRGVVCGKAKCQRCPHRAYWYAFVSFQVPTQRPSLRGWGGRTLTRVRCIYIGKVFTALTAQDLRDEEKRALADWTAPALAESEA